MRVRFALDAKGECELGPEVGAAGERLLQEVSRVVLLCLRLGWEQTHPLIDQSHCTSQSTDIQGGAGCADRVPNKTHCHLQQGSESMEKQSPRSPVSPTSIAATGGEHNLPLPKQQ